MASKRMDANLTLFMVNLLLVLMPAAVFCVFLHTSIT